MWAVCVVERLVFVQGVQEMSLVPEQGSVEQLAAAGTFTYVSSTYHLSPGA